MRKLKDNDVGSIIPIILFVLTIFALGAIYTLLFLEVAVPNFMGYIPEGDAKTFWIMLVYSIPLFILVVGGISLLKEGLKREWVME